MTRRKGEITGRMNERDFPHIVELQVPVGGLGDRIWEFDAFHRDRGIQSRSGRGRQDEDRFFVHYCLADPAIADAFRARFGGERIGAAKPARK
jgi:hypothetical protein